MVTITAENPEYDRIVDLGTFMWGQLTYTDLRGGNEVEEWDIAWIDEEGMWWLNENYAKKHDLIVGPYSDIIIG